MKRNAHPEPRSSIFNYDRDNSALGNLTVTASDAYANLTVNSGVQLSSGSPAGAPQANGVLSPSSIATKGNLLLSAGSAIGFGSGNTLTSFGGDIKATAKGTAFVECGTVSMGANNQFIANGGNIVVLARGVVSGTNNNFFYARAYGTSAANGKGGGIEIGSGLISSSFLSKAFSSPKNSNPNPGALGTNVIFTGNLGGVIKANSSGGGSINLNVTNLNPSLLFLNGSTVSGGGGVQVFDSIGAGSKVEFDGAQFQTEAFKPIAMVSLSSINESEFRKKDLMMSPGPDGKNIIIGDSSRELRLIDLSRTDSLIVQPGEPAAHQGKLRAQIFAKAKTRLTHSSAATLHLQQGEILVSACGPIQVKTAMTEVHAEKGAIATVETTRESTSIRACSGNGTVRVFIAGKFIDLNCGQEILVTEHKHSVLLSADGLGRRCTHTQSFGRYFVTTSDFSIVTLLTNAESPAGQLKSESSRGLLDRILKNAAAVNLVLGHRGAYTALADDKGLLKLGGVYFWDHHENEALDEEH